MLTVRGVTVRFGAVTAVAGADLDVPDGQVLALLGPSGCGKSTLLRAIAGLEPVVAGSVSWDGVDLARVPVHRRGFGLMFQDGVLFPHRTVAGNIGYGLRGSAVGTAAGVTAESGSPARSGSAAADTDAGTVPVPGSPAADTDADTASAPGSAAVDTGAGKAASPGSPRPTRGEARAARIAGLLELVGLAGYGSRRITTLSGGEAQRVALARALAPRPRLLLLDEPLAALDRSLREHLLADLRMVLTTTGTTAIFVTHDQAEAFAIASRVAVMRAGRIVQVGPPREVWARPADPWVARFLGCHTVLPARPARDADGSWSSVTALGSVPGRAASVGLRPTALVVDARGPLHGDVIAVVPGPEQQRLTVLLTGDVPAMGDVQAVAHRDEPVVSGKTVRLRWNPEGAALVGADPGPADGATAAESVSANSHGDGGARPDRPAESVTQ